MSEKIAVHCPTKELYNKVLDKRGITGWGQYWQNHTEESCVELHEEGLQSKKYWKEEGYTIISAQEYLKEEEIFNVGDRVECVDPCSNTPMRKRGIYTISSADFKDGYVGLKELADGQLYNPDRFKLTTNKPTTKEETIMNISDNFVEVFDSSAKLAKKMTARFGEQYGNNDRDLIALERDKGKLMAILEDEEKEAAKNAKK